MVAEVAGVSRDAVELLRYVEALQSFDWSFEFSDDPRVWREGTDKLAALRAMQKKIDPDLKIWNLAAPPPFPSEE